MNRVFVISAILVSNSSLPAQESPTTPKAAQVRIIQGPKIELAKEHLTIINWTTNNPGGSQGHYGIVHYGTDPNGLIETAKSPIRLNPRSSKYVSVSRGMGPGSTSPPTTVVCSCLTNLFEHSLQSREVCMDIVDCCDQHKGPFLSLSGYISLKR